MSMMLHGEFVDTSIKGRIFLDPDGKVSSLDEEFDNAALYGAVSGGRVQTISGNLSLANSHGGTILLNPPSSQSATYNVTLGSPGRVGRRFRIVANGTFSTANANVNIRVSEGSAAANRRIFGAVATSAAAAGAVVRIGGNRRVSFIGSATATSQIAKGDFLEFVDTGTDWLVSGFTGSHSAGSVHPSN